MRADIDAIARPRWKVVINAILRAVQPWRRKWVIYSVIECTSPPRVLGYGFGRVLHEDGPR
jgi:hypothetical protein